MKKHLSFGLFLISFLLCFNFAQGQDNNESNVSSSSELKDQSVVTIDGVDHLEETFYGKSGIFSIEEILNDLQVTTYDEDRIEAFPDPKYGLGSIVKVTRATNVKVIDAGEEKLYRTWKTNVKDFTDEAKITLSKSDKMSVKDNQTIENNLEIVITRVINGEIKKYEEIDFKTVTKKDDTLEKGQIKVSQEGKEGKKELTYFVKSENGKEVEKKLIKTEVVKEPQDKIVVEGTKVTKLGNGTATWYDLISGMTAASNTLPMGSKVLVKASNGKEIVVTIVDRGIQSSAIIDLSADAFKQLATLGTGKISVTLEKP